MNKPSDNELGKRIREIRIKNDLTQDQVAKALDATPGYVCNVENGRTSMSLRMLMYFAQLTHETIDSLVGSMDEAYAPSALDNEIMHLLSDCSADTKRKVIETIKLWKN